MSKMGRNLFALDQALAPSGVVLSPVVTKTMPLGSLQQNVESKNKAAVGMAILALLIHHSVVNGIEV